MNSSNYMVLCLGLIMLISLSQAKYYRIHPNYGFVDWVRGKRQSHPDVTQARLPLVPFQSSPPAELPSSLVPLEYLTPPAVDAPIGDQPSSTSLTTPPPAQIPVQRGEKWELGYDAGELLVPPLQDEQSTNYNSLKFQLSNTPLEVITVSPKLIPGEIPLIPFEQEIAASEVSGITNGKYGGSLDEPNYQIDNRHVHSFVKTDPHGHFKWGVHIGH